MTRKCAGCDSSNDLGRFENEAFAIEHAGAIVTIERLSAGVAPIAAKWSSIMKARGATRRLAMRWCWPNGNARARTSDAFAASLA